MKPSPVDGQWLDFYALLDVPVSADEDTIRKRIGKVYSEAAANSDHRDLSRRHYFQSLVERVLPQCRRVLLDPEWRAKYDRQHILHSINDPSAQDYVAFIASMRGKDAVAHVEENNLPQRLQDDIKAAREVVECARQGTELDLLPSKAVPRKDALTPDPTPGPGMGTGAALKNEPARRVGAPVVPARTATPSAPVAPAAAHSADAIAPEQVAAQAPVQSASHTQTPATPPAAPTATPTAAESARPKGSTNKTAVQVEEIHQAGEPVHAKVITAQEAAAIRRRRASNPDTESFAKPDLDRIGNGSLAISGRKTQKGPVSRVLVGAPNISSGRLISPTSMNLMVAIVGVMLTITIQRYATTPAIATSQSRTPIYLAVASEMETAMQNAESEWEKTPEGSNYDLMVQSVDSRAGLRRALGSGGQMPDAWIPSDSLWADRYNALAPSFKRSSIVSDQSIAQTPIVLVARSDRAAELRRRFPDHVISSWSALRDAVAKGAQGHLGLTDPQKAASGALARVSMAREWGESHNMSATQAAGDKGFWGWMAGFEDNAPAAPPQTGAMVKDLVQGTSGRFWWGIAYESDALEWMNQGKALEIYYLPRTTISDHPFCHIDRVGAPSGVAQGRASFEKFLRSTDLQKKLLVSGFRPIEVSLKSKVKDNPFLNPKLRESGARAENLPRAERINNASLEIIAKEWGRRYG
jgi:ABC-type Fe3+ transport system substrate-binding protein